TAPSVTSMRLQLPRGSSIGSASSSERTVTVTAPTRRHAGCTCRRRRSAASRSGTRLEVQRAVVSPAGIGVVVVAEREVDGADAPLLRRCAERRLLARAERELADHIRVLDTLDRPAQPLGLLAALD